MPEKEQAARCAGAYAADHPTLTRPGLNSSPLWTTSSRSRRWPTFSHVSAETARGRLLRRHANTEIKIIVRNGGWRLSTVTPIVQGGEVFRGRLRRRRGRGR